MKYSFIKLEITNVIFVFSLKLLKRMLIYLFVQKPIILERKLHNCDISLTAILRKAVDQNSSEGLLAVYLSFPSGCQFHILNPTLNGQQIKINQIHTFPGPEVSGRTKINLFFCVFLIINFILQGF